MAQQEAWGNLHDSIGSTVYDLIGRYEDHFPLFDDLPKVKPTNKNIHKNIFFIIKSATSNEFFKIPFTQRN